MLPEEEGVEPDNESLYAEDYNDFVEVVEDEDVMEVQVNPNKEEKVSHIVTVLLCGPNADQKELIRLEVPLEDGGMLRTDNIIDGIRPFLPENAYFNLEFYVTQDPILNFDYLIEVTALPFSPTNKNDTIEDNNNDSSILNKDDLKHKPLFEKGNQKENAELLSSAVNSVDELHESKYSSEVYYCSSLYKNEIEDIEVDAGIEQEVEVETVDEFQSEVKEISYKNDDLPKFDEPLSQEVTEHEESLDLDESLIIVEKEGKKGAAAKSAGNKVCILTIYPPPPAKGGISINSEDYKCLGENQYLNDVIIDFYLNYLHQNVLSLADKRRTHIFSSHFYTRLATPHSSAQGGDVERRYVGVQRWTKNVNIFEKDFVIVPVNEHAHWFLAIICFPNLVNIFGRRHADCFMNEDEAQRPCIIIFDSLSGTHKALIASVLRGYLDCEYLAKMQEEKNFSIDLIKTVYAKVPTQLNATDCGLYVLQYVESFFKTPIKDYTLPLKDLTNWFDSSVIERKREEIANLIADLAISYNDGRSVDLPVLKFPKPTVTCPSDNEDEVEIPICMPTRKLPSFSLTSTLNTQQRSVKLIDPKSNKFENSPHLRRSQFRKQYNNQSRAVKLVQMAKSIAERKERESKKIFKEKSYKDFDESNEPRELGITRKKLFGVDNAPEKSLLSAHTSTDPFYAFSMDALRRESTISPSTSYSSYLKIKKRKV